MTIKLNAKSFKNLLETIVREEKKKLNEGNVEELGNRPEGIADRFPKAYAALPDSYKNDSALTFYVDEMGTLCAEHDIHDETYIWDGRKWVTGDSGKYFQQESKKITLGLVKQIIKEEVARFSLKQTLKEVFKRHCKVNESVNFGALKKELESGFDHFKAENPNVKVGDFNWDTAIKGLMQDDEARQMMKVGDADGLVNKAIELAGVENVAGDVDVEKHAEDVFGNLQGDEKVDDSDVDAAFDNIQRKSA